MYDYYCIYSNLYFRDMNRSQHHETSSLLQSLAPSSSINNHTSTNYYSEKSSNQNSQLTQKMLLRFVLQSLKFIYLNYI